MGDSLVRSVRRSCVKSCSIHKFFNPSCIVHIMGSLLFYAPIIPNFRERGNTGGSNPLCGTGPLFGIDLPYNRFKIPIKGRQVIKYELDYWTGRGRFPVPHDARIVRAGQVLLSSYQEGTQSIKIRERMKTGARRGQIRPEKALYSILSRWRYFNRIYLGK